MPRRPAAFALATKLNIGQLIQLRAHVDALIADKRTARRQRLIETLKDEAAREGFKLEELFGMALNGRKPVAVKYRHPRNASLTWSGRGRPAKWLVELLKSGHKREEFAV